MLSLSQQRNLAALSPGGLRVPAVNSQASYIFPQTYETFQVKFGREKWNTFYTIVARIVSSAVMYCPDQWDGSETRLRRYRCGHSLQL